MKILFAGDTHGNITHWARLCKIARDEDVYAIIQLGDFGFWEHAPEGKVYLDVLDDMATVPIYFIDGNHDNQPLLWSKYCTTKSGMHHVRNKIIYISRGAAWSWAGWNFLALGGAFSIDQSWRKQVNAREGGNVCWWPEETITEAQVDLAITSGTILEPDIMLTHDAPNEAPISRLSNMRLSPAVELSATENRRRISEVVRMVKPSYLIHGHYHTRLSYEFDIAGPHTVECESIDCDPESGRGIVEDSYIIWELYER